MKIVNQSERYMRRVLGAFDSHMTSLWKATGSTESSVYYGKDGAIRLAHELGAGLADSPEQERSSAVESSYERVCSLAYMMNSPLTKEEWTTEVNIGLERALTLHVSV